MFKGNVRGFFEFRVCVNGQKIRGYFVEGRRKALRFLSLSFSLSLSLSLSFSLIPAPIDSFLRSGHLRRFRGQSDAGHFFRRRRRRRRRSSYYYSRLSKIARELPSS